MVAGGGLMSSVIFTIPPNLPLEREACGKALCLALLRNMSGSFKVGDKSVRNFDVVSYNRGQVARFVLYFYGSGGGLMSSVISANHFLIRRKLAKEP